MKKILAMMLSVAIIASIAISGTIAYFTDTESATNVFTVGKVDIKLLEEQRKMTVAENGLVSKSTDLEPFEQNKNLMPIVGSAQCKDDGSNFDGLGMTTAQNYQDKIVRVKNIGESDAYVRIYVGIPADLEAEKSANNPLHWNFGNRFDDTKDGSYNKGAGKDNDKADENSPYNKEFKDQPTQMTGTQTINGIKYNIYCFTRTEALKPGDTTAATLVGFYLDSRVDYNDEEDYYFMIVDGKEVKINYDFDEQEVYIPVYAEAVQAAGFATAQEAFSTAIEGNPSTTENPYNPWSDGITDFPGYTNVSNDKELKTALSANSESITVNLTADVNCDADSGTQYTNAMGGSSTKNITINGNGHKVTFKHPDSDANHIVTNGAKLVIQNATITNSGYNNGPWNRHDLVFDCDVVLNNVTSDKAIAFGGNATLNNVTIKDANTEATHAMWIQANGQTIDIDGLTIDMSGCSDGRGIAIKDEYVASPAKVTLNVKNASFNTQSKAAILVTSTAGADINLSGTIDLTNVVADTTNAVWVDKDSKYTASNTQVTVTGGNKIMEP